MINSDSSDILHVKMEGGSYDIIVEQNVLASVAPHLAVMNSKRCMLIHDNALKELASSIHQQLVQAGYAVGMLGIPSGDKNKNFKLLEEILMSLLDFKIDRKSFVIGLGGGVVGDIVGLAASLAMRGIPFVQIPTTLLAQVDSSVGGKTAINMPQGKNLVGAFWQPSLVLIDPVVLKTLPERELRAGYAEVLKYGLINDRNFFNWLVENGDTVLTLKAAAIHQAIVTSCRAKVAIVEQDEKETKGLRALLNLGHTFGHAIEAELQYDDRVLHGEAVAMGCLMAFRLSVLLGICPETAYTALMDHQKKMGFALTLPALAAHDWQAEKLLAHMALDKKVAHQQKTFVLARGIGEAFIEKSVEDKDVITVLREFI